MPRPAVHLRREDGLPVFAEVPVLDGDKAAGSRWIAATAMIATQGGPVAAGNLQPGMRVLSRDSGYCTIRSVERGQAVQMVEIAAGVLGNADPAVLPAAAHVLLAGDALEQVFGSREVLVAASALIDGVTVRAHHAAQGGAVVALVLDTSEIVWADGICIATSAADAPRSVLTGRDAAVALRLAGLRPEGTAVRAA